MENRIIGSEKFRRKLIEIVVTVALVMVKSSTPLVSIDKNDKLDLLIVENLSIISNKDFKDDGANHKELGEQLCAVKEILISNNIIIQKLCELEAKLDGVKSHPLSTYTAETRLHNLSAFESLDDNYDRTRSPSGNNVLLSPLVTKCIDKKKNNDEEESLNSYRRKLNKHLLSKFDEKMRGYHKERGGNNLFDRLQSLKCKENHKENQYRAKQRPLDLEAETSLTIKKDMKEEDREMSLPYSEPVHLPKQHTEQRPPDIVIS